MPSQHHGYKKTSKSSSWNFLIVLLSFDTHSIRLMFYFLGHERCRKGARYIPRRPVYVYGSFAATIGGPDAAASLLTHVQAFRLARGHAEDCSDYEVSFTLLFCKVYALSAVGWLYFNQICGLLHYAAPRSRKKPAYLFKSCSMV